MTKDDKVLTKIKRARASLVVSAPFYGCLALHLKLVCGDNMNFNPPLDTMAVDGVNIYYSSEYVMKITDEELIGVLVHEVSHCSHRHFGRLMGRNSYSWNIAGDLIINPEVINAGYKLHGKPMTFHEFMNNAKGYLLDPMFDGWSTEEIYKYVHQEVKKKGNQAGDGKGRGAADPGGCGAVMSPQEGKDSANGTGKDVKQIEADWETITRQAINVARASNAGNIPGHLKTLLDELNEPRVNWNQQIRRWADQSMRKEITWNKPNKRFIGMGIYLPGTLSNGISHLVVGVDTSASVDKEMLTDFATEIAALLDQGFCDKITVIYADTKVHKVDEYIAGDQLKLIAYGRGGTDFTETFNYINENLSDASGVIYFSDMYVSQYGEAPHCPTLWATYGRKSDFAKQAEQIPFGDVIHVH